MDGKELMDWLRQPWIWTGLAFLSGAALGLALRSRRGQSRRTTAGQWIFVLSLAAGAAVVIATWKEPSIALQILCSLLGTLATGALSWRVPSERTSVSSHGTQSPAVVANGQVVVEYGCPAESASDAMDAEKPEPSSAAAQGISVSSQGTQSPAVMGKGSVKVVYHDRKR